MALQEYYGETCPHCNAMKPIVAKAEEKFGVEFEKYEVWENEENAKMMEEVDDGKCGGVPFFYSTTTKEFICGSTDEETFLKWVEENK